MYVQSQTACDPVAPQGNVPRQPGVADHNVDNDYMRLRRPPRINGRRAFGLMDVARAVVQNPRRTSVAPRSRFSAVLGPRLTDGPALVLGGTTTLVAPVNENDAWQFLTGPPA